MRADGKARLFEQLKVFLAAGKVRQHMQNGPSVGHGRGAVRVAVHRLRKRYRVLLREEIAQTLSDQRWWKRNCGRYSGHLAAEARWSGPFPDKNIATARGLWLHFRYGTGRRETRFNTNRASPDANPVFWSRAGALAFAMPFALWLPVMR